MLISSTEVNERLENPDNIIRRRENDLAIRQLSRVRLPEHSEDTCAIAPVHNGGRRPGDKNITPESRAEIGSSAAILTLEEVAEQFDVSVHHAHELANGKHSNAQGQNPQLVEAINDKLDEPHQIALSKLTKTLLAIDDEKLKGQKPKDLAGMASQLARVAEQTAPIKHGDSAQDDALKKCQLIVYAPTIRQENKYETVQIATPVRTTD